MRKKERGKMYLAFTVGFQCFMYFIHLVLYPMLSSYSPFIYEEKLTDFPKDTQLTPARTLHVPACEHLLESSASPQGWLTVLWVS